MQKKTIKIIGIVIIIISAIAIFGEGWHKISENRKKAEDQQTKQVILDNEQETNANIETEILQNREIQLRITIPAQFKAMSKLLDRIYAPIDGKVENVFVAPGSIVKVGQPVIQIKSDTIGQIQLDFLDKYIDVNSNIKQMTAQYNLSVQNYKRENTLYHEGISSRAEYDVANAQRLKDKANLDSLKIQKRAIINVYAQRVALYGGSEATITKAASTKHIYPYITLYSHKNGVVLDRKVNPGEIIEQNKELFHIADLSTIWLVGYAFEKDAPLLKVGQKVVGIMEEHQLSDVKGHLSYVASVLDEQRKTLEVIADIPNKDFVIKPNMYAEMNVDIGKVKTLAVPNTALQKYGDYTFAYVRIKPHTYEERRVEIGQHNDKYTEVKSGLKIGEEVVSSGAFSLLGESIKKSEE